MTRPDAPSVRDAGIPAAVSVAGFVVGVVAAVWMWRAGYGWWAALPAAVAYVTFGMLVGARLGRADRQQATATAPLPSDTHVEVHIVGVVPFDVADRLLASIEGIDGVAVDRSEYETSSRLAVDVGADGDLLEVVEHISPGLSGGSRAASPGRRARSGTSLERP